MILSASRTRDMVQRSPDLLARILLGEAPCRWGPHGPAGQVDPAQLHTVVLWTKDLRHLLDHAPLRRALRWLVDRHGVLISIELTLTGMGGSFMEPGLAPWRRVCADLATLLGEGWVDVRAVVYRYDPFLAVRTPGGRLFGNARAELFREVCGAVLDLGVGRVTTSRADGVHYPRVVPRLERLGLQWVPISDRDAVALCREMDLFCRSRQVEFSVCCDPPDAALIRRWGCIDAHRLNLLTDRQAVEALHNDMGRQRPACRCTYSRDIGHSAGSASCFTAGFGCLYCYAQRGARPPREAALLEEISTFDHDPHAYLHGRDLPELLLS